MTYKFPRIELCVKAPVRYLKTFLLVLNGMMAAHNSCVFDVFYFWIEIFIFLNIQLGFDLFCQLKIVSLPIQVF